MAVFRLLSGGLPKMVSTIQPRFYSDLFAELPRTYSTYFSVYQISLIAKFQCGQPVEQPL